ncbi:MAG: hypothetical protein U0235_24040 [Polyangiaceae bacterium]
MSDLEAIRARCRGIKLGTLPLDEARALARGFELSPMTKVIHRMLGELDDYDGDFLVHDGPLTISGDLSVSELGAVVLIVKGNLTVTGCYSDTDDPQTITRVDGELRAGAIVTAGFLEVRGDVICEGPFFGDYNDCNCLVTGSVRCDLFYPEEHFFEVRGDLVARAALGNVKHRVSGAGARPEAMPMDDPRLLEHFDRELLRVFDGDEGEAPRVDGFDKDIEVRRRIRAGKPLKTP